MIAADEVMKELAKRNALIDDITPILGYDEKYKYLTTAKLARYACDSLKLKAPNGEEIPTLYGYIAATQKYIYGKITADEWFTVHPNGKENEGRPVYAEGGESKAEAIKRRFGDKPKIKRQQNSTLKPTNSKVETERHLQDGGYQIKNITPENHQSLNNALNNAYDKFGFNKITAINSVDDLDAYAQVNPDLSISINQNFCEYNSDDIKKYYDYEITNYKENTINKIKNDKKLIERGLKSAERDLKRHKRMAKFERFGVHTTPDKFFEETVNHELGHLISKQRILDAYKNDRTKAYELDKLITDSYKKAKKNNDIYKISYVADEDEQEYFAECFVAYNAGEKLPDHAKNMIETFMKKQ